MALPVGQISMSQVNTELSIPSTTTITFNQANVRNLAGVPSGAISMANLQGKSAVFVATISANQTNLDLYSYATSVGYSSGAAQITIAPGVFISSTSTASAGLIIPSAFGAGNLTLVNNGFIAGKGGAGGSAIPGGPPTASYGSPGFVGGIAMSIGTPMIFTNNSFVGGGGGGGGLAGINLAATHGGGGGGAGNGVGGTAFTPGGNGGLEFPGVGGSGGNAPVNRNGTAGGGGGAQFRIVGPPAFRQPLLSTAGGGGGWGAAGGLGLLGNTNVGYAGPGGSGNAVGTNATNDGPISSSGSGGAGGSAINLNGNTITYPVVGTIWGSIV